MPKAIRIHANGGPEVMRWEEVTLAPPGPGEARLRHTAIGVNFSDVNVRRGGFYIARRPVFPLIVGNEAAGVVESVGPGVTDVRPGDRVAYAGMRGEFFEETGAYVEARNVPVERLLKLPAGVSDKQAAALLVKGFTASLILNRVRPPAPGDTVLVHTAAGGVGMILAQWAKHCGAVVIGTAGSAEKARVAQAHGCDHVVLYREADLARAVRAIVPQGVAAVYDGVGKDTFTAALDCLRPFGMLVNYGNASGHPPPLDLLQLAKRGSLAVCRPALSSLTADVPAMRAAAAELFDLVARGVLRIEIGAAYPLAEAAAAHRAVEARAVAGSVVLIP
jgi:NADPH2:quinone reductase